MDWGMVLAVIFFAVTVVLSVVLARKLTRKKKPAWARYTRGIIGIGTGAPPELKLTFNGQPINNAYRTRFIFFNRGNETVRRDDVTQSILIHFQGAKILRPPVVLAQSKQAIETSVKQVVGDEGDAVRLSFLYLDHNDGMVVEVLHTESQNIKCSGNIIGTSEIRYIGQLINPVKELKWGIPLLVVSGVLLGLAIVGLTSRIWKESIMLDFGMLIFIVVIMPLLIGKELSFVRQGMKFPKWSRLKDLPTY